MRPPPPLKSFRHLESARRDAAFSLRSLARAPGFVASMVIALTLGIVVSVAVFHLIAAILIFRPPFKDPGALYSVGSQYRDVPFNWWRSGLYLPAIQNQTAVFSEFAAWNVATANVVTEGTPHADTVVGVTRGTFETLGIQPLLGRGFLPDEFKAANTGVAVVSYQYWQDNLHGNRAALGQALRVDEHPCTIVGVLPAGVNMPDLGPSVILRPLYYQPNPQEPFDPVLRIIGRLKPGIPVADAEAAVDRVKLTGIPQWAAAFFGDQKAVLQPIGYFSGRSSLWVLVAATGFLFVLACVNAANLMLVRIINRTRELSIRLAIGGSRAQVARLLLIEPLILIVLTAALAVAVVLWVFPPLLGTHYLPLAVFAPEIDRSSAACIALLSGVAALFLVAASVFRVGGLDVFASLKSGGNAMADSRGIIRLRNVLAIAQAALAVILLGGTGLMMRTFERVHRVDLGFNPEGKVVVGLMFPRGFEPTPRKRLQYFDQLQKRLGGLPGVRAASYGQDSILSGFGGTAQLLMADGSYKPVAGNFVSDGYQSALGMTMVRGRWFSDKFYASEVVINETLARMRFGDANPIGRPIRLQVSGSRDYLIVGVVHDVRDSVRDPSGPRIYFPDWFYPPNISTLVLRLDRDPPATFEGLVRRLIYQFDPNVVTTNVTTVHDTVDYSLFVEHFVYSILRPLTVIALGLSIIGLYSVMAYVAKARTREFGIRLAIGATAANLRRLVLVRSIRLAGGGILIGLAISLGATQYMKSLLFETTPDDPVVYVSVAVVLILAAIVAAWLPARRAAATDPVKALRTE